MTDHELRYRFRRIEDLLRLVLQQTGADEQQLADLSNQLEKSEIELQAAISAATPHPPPHK